MSTTADLLSRREAADLAGVHTNTVLAWERNGLIKVARVRVRGKQETRIPRAELERVLREQGKSVRRRADRRQPIDDEANAVESRVARRLAQLRLRDQEQQPNDLDD